MEEEAHLSEAEIQETPITDPLTAPTPILTPNIGWENYTDPPPTIFQPTIEYPPLTTTEYESEATIEYPSLPPNPVKITGVPSMEPTEDSAETAGVRRSSRAKTAPISYTPGFHGKTYSSHLQLPHPDTHSSILTHEVFATPTDPQVLATIMTQPSLKAGLKARGDKASQAVHSEMKQLHFRDTFLPKHWKDLNETQRKTILESHMFLKEKEMARSKDEPLLKETSKETTSPRKMPALPLLPQKLSYSHVSSMLKKAGMWQLLIFPMLSFKPRLKTKLIWPL
jgi:hypothetical protein